MTTKTTICETKLEKSTIRMNLNRPQGLYVTIVLDADGFRVDQALAKTLKIACEQYGRMLYDELQEAKF
jgi:hypothetical protein